jgi:SAM-dependent methyltransferase
MGLPKEEMAWQIEALRKIHMGLLTNYELFVPETKLPRSVGSKHYRESPDDVIADLLGKAPARVLVWGAGDGVFEESLKALGFDVFVIPMTAVVGESCRHRGLTVLPPDLKSLKEQGLIFDAVVLRDVLHLLQNPSELLVELRALLAPHGSLVGRVPNLNNLGLTVRRVRDPRFKVPWTRDALGARPMRTSELKRILLDSGYSLPGIRTVVPENRRTMNALTLGIFAEKLSPYLYFQVKA